MLRVRLNTRTAPGNAIEAYTLQMRCWGLYLRYVEGALEFAHSPWQRIRSEVAFNALLRLVPTLC